MAEKSAFAGGPAGPIFLSLQRSRAVPRLRAADRRGLAEAFSMSGPSDIEGPGLRIDSHGSIRFLTMSSWACAGSLTPCRTGHVDERSGFGRISRWPPAPFTESLFDLIQRLDSDEDAGRRGDHSL